MEFRIQLVSPTWEDMEFIRWLWSDPDTMESVGGPVLLSKDRAERWFEYMIEPGRPSEHYRVILNEFGKPIGEVSFHHLNPDTMTAMFNLKISHSERGKGYGREAMLIFLDHFFNEVEGMVMIDDVAPDNLRGQQVLLRFGFEHDESSDRECMLRLTKERFNMLYKLLE